VLKVIEAINIRRSLHQRFGRKLAVVMTTPQVSPRKLTGWELYRDVMGSPKGIVAPMVDQSELPWRILSRRYGGQLAYTPMINAKIFSDPGQQKVYRDASFNLEHGEEGRPGLDWRS